MSESVVNTGAVQAVFRTEGGSHNDESLISSIIDVLDQEAYAITWAYVLDQIQNQADAAVRFSGTTDDAIAWRLWSSGSESKRALIIGDTDRVGTIRQYLEHSNQAFDDILHEQGESKLDVLRAISHVARSTRQGDVLLVYFGEQEFIASTSSADAPHAGDAEDDTIVVKYNAKGKTQWMLSESEFLFCLSHQQGEATVIMEQAIASSKCFSSFPVQFSSHRSDIDSPLLVQQQEGLHESYTDFSYESESQDDPTSPRSILNFPTPTSSSRRSAAKLINSIGFDLVDAFATQKGKHYGINARVDIVLGPAEAFCNAYHRKSNVRHMLMGMRAYLNRIPVKNSSSDNGDAEAAAAAATIKANSVSFASSKPIDDIARLDFASGRTKRALLILPNGESEASRMMLQFLLHDLEFITENIVVLKDGMCTRNTILEAMLHLRHETHKKDHAFVYYQGSGSEKCMTPNDKDPIYSEEIFETLIYPMTHKMRLTMVLESSFPISFPYSIEADDTEAIAYIPSNVTSIRLCDTTQLISKLEQISPFSTGGWRVLADSLAKGVAATISSSRPISNHDDDNNSGGNELAIISRGGGGTDCQKRALLIRTDQDPSSVEKAERFALHLQRFHGFAKCDMCLLQNTEELERENIMSKICCMAADAKSGDSLVLYYCGESKETTRSNDLIIPSDSKTAGSISGNNILHRLIKPLSEGTMLTLVFDTAQPADLPLPFYYSTSGNTVSDSSSSATANKPPTSSPGRACPKPHVEENQGNQQSSMNLSRMLFRAFSGGIVSLADEVSQSEPNVS